MKIDILKTLGAVTIICLFFYSKVLAVPLSNEKITNNSTISANSQKEIELGNQYKSGDTVSFICPEIIFKTPVSDVTFYGIGSDCWGWVDSEGTEYAIYATSNTIEFYNLSNNTLVSSIPSPLSSWHDIKTYQHYCYSVSEATGANDGISVIDMQYLPDSVHFINSFPIDGMSDRTSHNMTIDTVQGYAYIEGSAWNNSSIHILSLANPEVPTHINSFSSIDIHDLFCHNDTLFIAEPLNASFSIWNMVNKNSPELLARVTIPNAGYVHNIWPTGDKRHILTTEETADKTIKLWNIEDLNNILLTDEFLGASNLAHNAHIVGDTAYVSHYESGVSVLDLSNPDSIVEINQYDTYPASDNPEFKGCWGVYPHTPSGQFYASNFDGFLFILNQFETILADTMVVLNAQALPGSTVKVNIWAKYTLDIHDFEIPINWGGEYNLSLDSFSTVGLITEYFEIQQYSAYDAFFKRVSVLLRTSLTGSSPDLPSGEGVILSVYFTIPDGATGVSNPITLTPFNTKESTFGNKCIKYTPDTLNGIITLGEPICCVGLRGNVNGSFENPPTVTGVDVSDLVYLVAFSFQGGPAPICEDEADINGSSIVDVSDLVYLVAFMFQGGDPPLACP